MLSGCDEPAAERDGRIAFALTLRRQPAFGDDGSGRDFHEYLPRALEMHVPPCYKGDKTGEWRETTSFSQ